MKRPVKALVAVALAALFIGCVTFGAVMWHIQKSVAEYAAIAQRACPHPGENVIALIDFVNSSSPPLQDRNLAVWALGRLRDSRALPVLKAHYTGEPCNHEMGLCQYELAKAITRCGEVPNPPLKGKHG